MNRNDNHLEGEDFENKYLEGNDFKEENLEDRSIDKRKAMKNILSLLKDYKLKLIISTVFTIISSLFLIYGPLLIGDAITIIYDGANNIIHNTGTIDFNALAHILIIATIIYILSGIFEYLQEYLIIETVAKISFSLRERLIRKVTHLPMGELEGIKRGDILSRITNDVDTLETGMLNVLAGLLRALIMIIGMTILMLTINFLMTLAIFILIPIIFILMMILLNIAPCILFV